MAKIVVPDPAGESFPDIVSLPPRQKRRKREKPKLSKDCPDGLEPINREPEMHPAIVVILGLFIFMNGWEAATRLIYVPFIYAINGSVDEAIDEVSDEHLDELEMTRHDLKQTWRMATTYLICLGNRTSVRGGRIHRHFVVERLCYLRCCCGISDITDCADGIP